MSQTRRLVVVDPGLAGPDGHHAALNRQLLPVLRLRGWQPELWADAGCRVDADQPPGLRPLLRDAGYIDPRHWCDLPGSLHQASRLRPQLELAAAGEPVAVWVAHSLLPFQLIALAQLLQRQPPARVLISLMFAPGEVFGGQPEHDLLDLRQSAVVASRAALAALQLAAERGGHRLILAAGSQQLLDRYAPLCLAAGLEPPLLHPVVITASLPAAGAEVDGPGPRILLHCGDRRPDKGRELALAVLERLLEGPLPPPLDRARWWFHAGGGAPAPEAESALLRRCAALQAVTVAEGVASDAELEGLLARTDLALLPYCPIAYAERSSGLLWLYASARHRQGLPARVAGFNGGWLAAEVPALGLGWYPLPAGVSPASALPLLAAALAAPAPAALSAYGRSVLEGGFAAWLADRISLDSVA